MPYQVSWQSVAMKSQAPVHVLGADADVVEDVLAGEALLATASAAHAPLAAPAAARIVAANMQNLVMAAPCLNREHPDLKKVSYKIQSASHAAERNIIDTSGRRATGVYAGTTGTLVLRSASITCRSNFKCASTSSGGVKAIH